MLLIYIFEMWNFDDRLLKRPKKFKKLINTVSAWTKAHDDCVDAIKSKNDKELEELLSDLNDVNASHHWRDAHYSLLFHASTESNTKAFQLLLDRGADPGWRNQSGYNVLKLLAKRDQVGMAEAAWQKMSAKDKDAQKEFMTKFNPNSGKNEWERIPRIFSFFF